MDKSIEPENMIVNSSQYWNKGEPTQVCRLHFLLWKMPRSDRRLYEAYLRQSLSESLLLSEMLEALTPKFLTPGLASELMELEAEVDSHRQEDHNEESVTDAKSAFSDSELNELVKDNSLIQVEAEHELPLVVVAPRDAFCALDATRSFVTSDGQAEADGQTYTLLEARHRVCDLLEQSVGSVYLVVRMNVEAAEDESYRHLATALVNRVKFKLGPVYLTLLRAAMGLQYRQQTESFLYHGLSLPEVDGHQVSETERVSLAAGSYRMLIKGYKERAHRLGVLANAVAYTTKTDTELVALAEATGGSGERLFTAGPCVPFVSFVGERDFLFAIANHVRSTLDTKSPVTVSPTRDNAERFLRDQLREQNLDLAPTTQNLVKWLGETSSVERMFQFVVGCQDPFTAS